MSAFFNFFRLLEQITEMKQQYSIFSPSVYNTAYQYGEDLTDDDKYVKIGREEFQKYLDENPNGNVEIMEITPDDIQYCQEVLKLTDEDWKILSVLNHHNKVSFGSIRYQYQEYGCRITQLRMIDMVQNKCPYQDVKDFYNNNKEAFTNELFKATWIKNYVYKMYGEEEKMSRSGKDTDYESLIEELKDNDLILLCTMREILHLAKRFNYDKYKRTKNIFESFISSLNNNVIH